MNPETPVYPDVAYGPDKEQQMDLYLPEKNMQKKAKVFLLLHGGGWNHGDKEKMNFIANYLRKQFPDHAVANINYRLATDDSPGFPKQTDDIALAITYLQNNSQKYGISNQYAFVGSSAGAHLALLYSYKYDHNAVIKAVSSFVGPVDFTDPSYTEHIKNEYPLKSLIGKKSYKQFPELYQDVSPITHITAKAPPTLAIYGQKDPLVPYTQAKRLKDQLDHFGVLNESYVYPNEAHGDWSAEINAEKLLRMTAFFQQYFN